MGKSALNGLALTLTFRLTEHPSSTCEGAPSAVPDLPHAMMLLIVRADHPHAPLVLVHWFHDATTYLPKGLYVPKMSRWSYPRPMEIGPRCKLRLV